MDIETKLSLLAIQHSIFFWFVLLLLLLLWGFFEGPIFKVFSFQQFDQYTSKKHCSFYIVNNTFTGCSEFPGTTSKRLSWV